jgi:hypothetical protein
MRDWCAATGYPLSDLIGRGRAVREAGLLTQGGHGVNAPAATLRDGAVLLLSIVVARIWKDAPKEVVRYGSLLLEKVTGHDLTTRTEYDPDPAVSPLGRSLLDALTDALKHCGSNRVGRLSSLIVERSEANPEAVLTLEKHEVTPSGETHTKTFWLTFMCSTEQTAQKDAFLESGQLNASALNAMADLLADNLRSTHENGPSVDADEPLPPDDETPRGANPATTTTTQSKARRERDKSQAGLQSYGNSSGGSSFSIRGPNDLPNRGTPDEKSPSRPG